MTGVTPGVVANQWARIDVPAPLPAALAAEGRFCRAAMALHGLAVFQFEEAGERCLVRVVRFEEDQVRLTVQD